MKLSSEKEYQTKTDDSFEPISFENLPESQSQFTDVGFKNKESLTKKEKE